MAVDRAQLDALRADRSRLVAVLTDAGATFKGDKCRCPFHDDANPSAGVYEIDGGGWRFTCQACGWNGGKKSGDVVDVVRRFHKLDFAGACARLGLNGSAPSNGRVKPAATGPENRVIEHNGPALTSDTPRNEIDAPSPSLHVDFEHLQSSRGIDRATAERFGVGMVGEPGRRYWTFPVADGVVKAHRADGQDSKSWWKPKGVPCSRVWPVSLDGPGPVWVCPGELKALALIACGLPAIGITSGEGNESKPTDLPAHALELLAGWTAAIPPDDDPVGRAWGEHVGKQLADAGIETRIVKLPLCKAGGLKDIGDLIVDLQQSGKAPDEIAASLSHYYCLSPQVPGRWAGTLIGDRLRSGSLWEPVTYVPTGLRRFDSRTCGGLVTGGVHMFGGKTGSCKTQVAAMTAGNAALAKIPTAYLSLELNWKQVTRLFVAQRSGIPRNKIASGNLDAQDGAAVRQAITDYGDAPLWIFDDGQWPGGPTRNVLGSVIRDGVRRFKWKLVVIDYLNLIDPEPDDREQFTTDLRNSTTLKKLACELEIALLVVASVRKGGTYRSNEQLKIDDLAGAGRLAYDSTNVFFVTRELGEEDCGIVKIRPMKMRFAPCDDNDDPLCFRWRPRSGQIVDLNPDEAPLPVKPANIPGVIETVVDGGDDTIDLDQETAEFKAIGSEIEF